MVDKDDWRLTAGPVIGFEEELKNIPLYFIPFQPLSETWDHEHCAFCWAKFYRHDGCLWEGYCTRPENTRDAHWICPECYEDFKEMFGWRVIDAAETVERVRRMETLYDLARETGDEQALTALAEYMDSGLWLADYSCDEQGLLPKGLKRGVLSQDGLYDLLRSAFPSRGEK